MVKIPKDAKGIQNSPFEKSPRFYVMKGDKKVAAYQNVDDAFKHMNKAGAGHSVVRTAIKTFKVQTHSWNHPDDTDEK